MGTICFLADADSIHIKKWVEYFSRFEFEIHIISMRGTKYKYRDNVHLHIIEPPFKNKLSYILLINKIKKLVREIKPDILHSHYATSYGLFGRMCSYHPFIVSAWGSDVYEFPRNMINRGLLNHVFKGADIVCSTSYEMANEIRKYYDKKIVITPFGVDTVKFDCSVPIFENSYVTIGIVKNLEKVYGIDLLIEAFSEVCKTWKDDELRLMIVGDGSQSAALRSLCKRFNIIDKVIFTGAVQNENVPEFVNMMDFVCLPSLSEGFGVSAVEACACGRPVIGTNVGGLKEIVIDGYNGFLINPGSVDEIKNKIIYALNNRELLKTMSENARKFIIEKYDWEGNAEIMKNLYTEMIEDKQK